MKPLQVILPDIHRKTYVTEQKTKRKFFRAWPVRDTFTNWNKNNKIEQQKETLIASTRLQDLTIAANRRKKILTKQQTCGITLEQYFRQTNFTSSNQQKYCATEESLFPYIQHNFLIQQADQQQNSQQQSQKQPLQQQAQDIPISKRSLTKQLRQGNFQRKMKTEQSNQVSLEPIRIREYTSKSRQKFSKMQQSFELKQNTYRHKGPLDLSIFKTKYSSSKLINKWNVHPKQNKLNIENITKYNVRLKQNERLKSLQKTKLFKK